MSNGKKSFLKNKTFWYGLLFFAIIVLFFSVRLVITFDSAHYLGYVEIFEGRLEPSSWDIVRGPIFPLYIFFSDILFGKTQTGLLVASLFFYALFTIVVYLISKEIFQKSKKRELWCLIVTLIAALNPLIFGFFHVLLTEFMAITITMLNIYLAYKWIEKTPKDRAAYYLIPLYFIFNLAFCFHLKQPYIVISLVPLITSAIISICQNHTLKNILYRAGTAVFSIIFLIISMISWNSILRAMNADMGTGRDSSTMLSQQLLNAFGVTYDNDGDGKNDPISTFGAIGEITKSFFTDPLKISGNYLQNYCALSSLCEVTTEDGAGYKATSKLSLFSTYENSIIGYRAYKSYDNVFHLPEYLQNYADHYGKNPNRGLVAQPFLVFVYPTNILFKISTLFCLPFLIFLIVIKIRAKKSRKNQPLFYISLILLLTSVLHMLISAGIGLIIDRYAVEIFVPSSIGMASTIVYFVTIKKSNKKIGEKNA